MVFFGMQHNITAFKIQYYELDLKSNVLTLTVFYFSEVIIITQS